MGVGKEPITIQQETDYPFGDEINLRLILARRVAFGLSLRIPAWCKEPKLALNRAPISPPPIRKGFIRLERVFHPGDLITLPLPMRIEASHWPDDGAVGVEHGPLVYSLPIKEQWMPVVTPKWSSPGFPQWNAFPMSDWSYGLALDEARGEIGAVVERGSLTPDPWIDPPVNISVPVKQVSEWKLHSDNEHPDRLKTPPLPDIHREESASLTDVERVKLSPYGSTQLRLTIFPKV